MRLSLQIAGTLVLIALGTLPGLCQTPGSAGSSGHSVANQLPLSDGAAQWGSAQASQTVTSNGVSTVSSSVQVTGNLAGSIPAKDVPAGPIRLTVAEAVRRAISSNLGSISASNAQSAARAERLRSLGNLLPSISVDASETVTQVNLAAYGLKLQTPPGINFSVPTIVGPYSYSQLQGALSQSVFDLVQKRNYQASKSAEQAAAFNFKDTREALILAVAGTYLQTVALEARLQSQNAQVTNAQAVYQQASTRKAAGTNAKIDVIRSLVELQTQQQRLQALQGDLRKQKLVLARLVGLPLDRELDLTESLTGNQTATPEPASTIELAMVNRADLKALTAQVRTAELAVSATRAERYPTATVNGNYGVIGANPAATHGVFAVTAGVSMNVWDGGRIKADIQQAETTLRQRRAELDEYRSRIESEVRTALIELETAAGQLRLAATNRDYANETLTEARDRFGAGVATTVEVVQAQEQVSSAENDYVSGLFSFNLARLTLARATGQAEASLPDFLKRDNP
ncbi:MAG: TolC family protein [Bryobacteraceae bacterium]